MIAKPLAASPAPAGFTPEVHDPFESGAELRPADFRWTVVPHTHWDREWYSPFETFRLRLAGAIDDLLDLLERDPDFRTFTLDGQSVILEDYVALHPHSAERLRRHLESGRLVAGPAYVLPDEFLAPQEALVRNLLIGRRVTRDFGARPMEVGYQPDPFGHVAQLPQILQGFGLDHLIFWRGMGAAGERVGALFAWRGFDGSTVTGIRQLGGYGNASELGRWGRDGRDHGDEPDAWEDVAVDRLARYLERFGTEVRRDGATALLLCNGSDHQPAWAPLPRMLGAIRRAHPGIDIEIGTYEEFIANLAPDATTLPVVDGELREGRDAHILRGIDSARMYVKQANESATQALLAAESMASLALLAGRARPSLPALTRAWKLLLRNQPHDSISGCSVDHVHEEMLVRYRKVEQLASRIATESVAALAGVSAPWLDEGPPRDWVSVLNPVPHPRQVVVRLPLPAPLLRARSLVGKTADGTVPVQVEGGAAVVALDVAGFGATSVRLLPGEAAASPGDDGAARAAGPAAIENGRLRVEAASNGTFSVTDLVTGRAIEGVGLLEDVGDRGDEYDFCPVDGEAARTSADVHARVRIRAQGPVVAELEVRYDAVLPARVSSDRRSRIGRVRCAVRTVARLIAGGDRVELETTIDNRARDHRIRVIVPAPDAPTGDTPGGDAPIRAEGHFAVLRRAARPAAPSNPGEWAQLPQPTNHTTGFVAAGSTVLFGRGLPEYEAIERRDGGVDLALTLLRCVGWLSRDDLSTRPGGAGPAIETPGAQCQGRHTFEYAVSLDGEAGDAALVRASADYRAAVLVGPPGADPARSLAVDGDVAFAALKPADDGEGVVLRLYNPSATTAASDVSVRGPEPLAARRVRLDETPLDDDAVPQALGPGAILSFRIPADGPRRDLPSSP